MSDPNMIPNNIPPNAGWVTAAVLGLLALGKPALDAWRNIRSKSEAHERTIAMREITQREQEDRDLIALLKDEIKTLRDELRALRSKFDEVNDRRITLERDNAVLEFRIKLYEERT